MFGDLGLDVEREAIAIEAVSPDAYDRDSFTLDVQAELAEAVAAAVTTRVGAS